MIIVSFDHSMRDCVLGGGGKRCIDRGGAWVVVEGVAANLSASARVVSSNI